MGLSSDTLRMEEAPPLAQGLVTLSCYPKKGGLHLLLVPGLFSFKWRHFPTTRYCIIINRTVSCWVLALELKKKRQCSEYTHYYFPRVTS